MKQYKIPKRKKKLITKEFLEDFKNELDSVFKEDIKQINKEVNYWNFYQAIESTSGFYESLKNTCKKHNLTKAIYQYANKMPWYDSDIFDGELTILMCKNKIIPEGNIDEEDLFSDSYYKHLEQLEKDGEIFFYDRREYYKGYNVIYKDWDFTRKENKLNDNSNQIG